MKYTGPTFRPPLEANTLLLQVTVGCAYNKCSFCTMYKDIKFHIEGLEQIEKDLQEAKSRLGSVKRIFLVNGDAFVLSARRLKDIADLIISYFPQIETITMYASIRNIRDKSDQALKMLKQSRINELWIGLETGHANTLDKLNKGYSLDEVYTHLNRLNELGILFNGIFMLGAGGLNQGQACAVDTAKLINTCQPNLVGFTTLGLFNGSQLETWYKKGDFIPATELEILEEEKTLLENIHVESMPFFANHPTNAANLSGRLPRDRQAMIDEINSLIEDVDDDFLMSYANRFGL